MVDRPNSRQALVRATAIGTVLQVAMVVAGHYSAAVAGLFAVGGMTISLLAGVLYARWSRAGTRGAAAGGGAIAGAACAFLGILVSVLLGDVPMSLLAFGSISSAVTGAIGGALGRPRSVEAAAMAAVVVLVLHPAAEARSQDLPEGWRVLAEAGDPGPVHLQAMAPGWHLWPGPSAAIYEPERTVGDRFSVDYEAHVFAGESTGYGIFFGAAGLADGRFELFEVLLDGEGRFRLGHDAGPEYHEVIPWTHHEAIAVPAPGVPANNRLRVEVSPDRLAVTVNGVEVSSFDPPAYASFEGVVGLRALDGTSVHITNLEVSDLNAVGNEATAR